MQENLAILQKAWDVLQKEIWHFWEEVLSCQELDEKVLCYNLFLHCEFYLLFEHHKPSAVHFSYIDHPLNDLFPQRVKADQNPAGLTGRTNKNLHHRHRVSVLQQPGGTSCCHSCYVALRYYISIFFFLPLLLFKCWWLWFALCRCRRLWARWSTPAEPRTSWTNLRSTRNSPRGRSSR